MSMYWCLDASTYHWYWSAVIARV